MARETPSAVTAMCPDCEEETLHSVLKGTAGGKGGAMTLDATVQCEQCSRVHHVVLREPAPLEVPVVISSGDKSTRTKLTLPSEDDVAIGEAFIVDGINCKLTGIEAKDMRWVEAAALKDVKTLWVKAFDEVMVKFAINMDHKTITKAMPCEPEQEFTVGEELLFGRLRVTIHAIKTEERLLKRGTAEAAEIVRVFGRPTPLGTSVHRPDKKAREQLRNKEEKQAEKRAKRITTRPARSPRYEADE